MRRLLPSLALFLAALCVLITSPARAQSRRPANLHQSVSTAHDSHMVSWVVLSNSFVELNEEKLRAKLDEAFAGAFLPQRNEKSFVVKGPVPEAQFLIQSRIAGAAGIFMLNTVPGPYTHFSDFDKFITDRATQRQARAQRSWLSIDLVKAHSNSTEADAYRFIGRALAKLAPRNAAYLVHPTRRVVIAFDEEVRRRLENGEQLP